MGKYPAALGTGSKWQLCLTVVWDMVLLALSLR
jgi:hypothetical protein